MSLVVVKVGGSVARDAIAGVEQLRDYGHDVCVVHGAGPQISAALSDLGLAVEFVRGRRVTSYAALAVVRDVLARVNRELCSLLGPVAIGLMGDEIGLLARRVPALGHVGDPIPTNPSRVLTALRAGRVPVVAPLAAGPLNVNADEMAAALAAGLGAARIQFETDVPGVLRDGAIVSALDADEADELLALGEFQGGIVPKLQAAVLAARLGIRAEIGETAVVA